MSGRLIILPKKSYCPWNPDNVARVERDEALHRQQQERELGNRQSKSTQQLIMVQQHSKNKKNQSIQPETQEQDEPQQHVNLFQAEQEEAAVRELAVESAKTCRLGMTAAAEIPFYLQPAPSNTNIDEKEREPNRKASLDPAMQFMSRDSSSRTHDKRRRRHDAKAHDRHAEESKAKSSSPSKQERHGRRKHQYDNNDASVDHKHSKRSKRNKSLSKDLLLADLRQRRHEREQVERSRQEAALGVAAKSRQRYNDQFYPTCAK